MPKQSKSQQAKAATTASQNAGGQDAVALLSADHRKVEQLFEQYQSAGSEEQKSQLARQVCIELTIHTMLEEEIFYPACREKGVGSDAMDRAQVEHDSAKILIEDLMSHSPSAPYYDAKVTVLSEYIKEHVEEEENAGDGIFAKAAAAGVDMNAVGQKLSDRKAQLMGLVQSRNLQPPRIRSLELAGGRGYAQEDVMNRQYDRDRDEQGRFMSEDRGYRGRDRDDDERYESGGRSRSRGGWFGDPEGHSRASEEGWEQRGRGGGGYSRGRDYDDDDYRGSSGGRSGRGGGHGGWFGDPEGHSRASEEGWEQRGRGGGGYSRGRDYDDDDYRSSSGGRSGRGGGHGGWFGDSEGHSRASEEGWRHREGGGRYSSRGRDYEDDDRRGGRGGGHGGWFGDSEGHSRAAERGWEDRGHRGGR